MLRTSARRELRGYEEKLEAIDAENQKQIEKIYEQADASPFPDPEEVYDNIYSDMKPASKLMRRSF